MDISISDGSVHLEPEPVAPALVDEPMKPRTPSPASHCRASGRHGAWRHPSAPPLVPVASRGRRVCP